MPRLLHISSSPRGERSESLALATTFLSALRESWPELDIEQWDLWDGTLPEFGPPAAAAKMRVFAGDDPAGREAEAWHRARRAFERFAAADLYLFSVPMWNGGIPYILKQLIDVVSQPGMVFTFDPASGYAGLLTGRAAVAVYTSAVYGQGRPQSFGSDFQAPYLEDWLRWTGIADIRTVEFRPNLATSDADEARRLAHEQARAAALELSRTRRRLAS